MTGELEENVKQVVFFCGREIVVTYVRSYEYVRMFIYRETWYEQYIYKY